MLVIPAVELANMAIHTPPNQVVLLPNLNQMINRLGRIIINKPSDLRERPVADPLIRTQLHP